MYDNTNMQKYENLFLIAKEASKNAYAPYSKFPVGAALLYDDDTVYIGANVENSSYGLTLCAERNAISSAIANGQKGNIQAIAIYSPNMKKCAPCGACRQWIWEFEHGQNIKVILEGEDGKIHITDINSLIPMGFKF